MQSMAKTLMAVVRMVSTVVSDYLCACAAGSGESDDADLPPTDLFCPACNKFFKTANA